MTVLDRRQFAAAAAAQAPPSQARLDAALIRRHDETVERLLGQQRMGAGEEGRGSYPDEFGLFHAGTAAGLLDAFMAAYACPGSRFQGQALMVERALAAAQFLSGRQHEDGTIDLLTTNFHSTPDLGFVVYNAAAAAELARMAKADRVLEALRGFLAKAKEALIRGGVHTPNHRWVVCGALAMLHHLSPDPRCLRRIGEWLAEGIDIDADGQYAERSTGIYNPVTDKALLVTALLAGRPELADPVRRNLRAMLYLLQPGGEVVTGISTRQDQYMRTGMERYWMPLRYLAIQDGDGQLAALAQSVEERGASVSEYLRFPELRRRLPAAAPLPDGYHRLMKGLAIARIRRGRLDATVMLNGNSRLITLRNGGCVIEAVRVAAAFFGKGQFRPTAWAAVEGGYRMSQRMEGPYYQPLDPPQRVTAENFAALRAWRRQSEVQHFVYAAEVGETKNGFRLSVEAGGTVHVPVAVEIAFREGVRLAGVEPAPGVEGGWLLRQGYGEARREDGGFRFGPGSGAHAYTRIRGAEPKLAGPSVSICGFTPFHHTLEFEAL